MSVKVAEGAAAAFASVVIAFVVSLVFDFAGSADLSFYATLAQVIPVFLVAAVLEARGNIDGPFESSGDKVGTLVDQAEEALAWDKRIRSHHGKVDDDHAQLTADMHREVAKVRRLQAEFSDAAALARRIMLGYIFAAGTGEVAALVALGMGAGSTFLMTLSALSLASIVALWILSIVLRYSVEW